MFQKFKIYLKYCVKGNKKAIAFDANHQNEDLSINIAKDQILEVSIHPKECIVMDDLYIEINYDFKKRHKIFVNGYQSWTDSREFSISEKIKDMSPIAKMLNKKYHFTKYGDYEFYQYSRKQGHYHGFTYSYIREDRILSFIGSLSERSGFTIIEYKTNENKILIRKDGKGLTINKEYTPFQLTHIIGEEDYVFDKYFSLMNIKKPQAERLTGFTSWYHYYQNINEDIILENIQSFKKNKKQIDLFQIDDGYQNAVGDWLDINFNKFPSGMKYISNQIKNAGYKAGIWLAPFVCETNSKIYREKKDWILRDEDDKLVVAGCNWSQFYALDFYHQEVRDYIKKVFQVVLNDWNYDLVKLDFLYAVCLIPRKDKTRGQIMSEAMDFLRECVGEKLILGCGVPLGPAFGKVDYCRIGCDVGLDWNDNYYMRLIHRERVSTINSIRNAIGRRQLNNRAFLNDPDVFILRDENNNLSTNQKKTLALVNQLFGSVLFTSDNISHYTKEQKELYNQIINFKHKELKNVIENKDGLIEVMFKENKHYYLALINLSKKEIIYDHHYGSLINENINLQPYESKTYKIH